MEVLTLEQIKMMKTWASERDAILSEISKARTEYDLLLNKNTQLNSDNSSVFIEIIAHKKAVEVINGYESDRSLLISKELSEMITRKTILESSVLQLEAEVAFLSGNKMSIIEDIKLLSPLHEKFLNQTRALEHTVEHVVRVNESNTNKVNIMVSSLKNFLSDIKLKS